ncbi:MAG: restriction endonuclease [Thermodesulfovibrionales bacterium]|jgi:hypothetical protein
MVMIFDYSKYVEVVAREADSTAYPYFPSDLDFENVAPRLLSQFKNVSKVIPSSLSSILMKHLGKSELSSLIEARITLFNSIEDISISPSDSSIHRALTDWMGSVCYVCKSPTHMVRDERGKHTIPHVKVRACPKCGWWESENTAHLRTGLGRSYDSYTLLRRACLREFAIFDDEAPLDALRSHFRKHPKDLNRISPKKLEHLVGSIFEDYFSCEVIRVGGPGDGGFDLLLIMSENPAVVQVKQRIDPNKSEPVSSIREFVGAMMLSQKRVGFFVSSASKFSNKAQEAATKAESICIEKLEIIDASRLIDILDIVSHKAEPWKKYAHSLDDKTPDFSKNNELKFLSY